MSTNCTRCESSGFLNIHQLPDSMHETKDWITDVQKWIAENPLSDVCICDCCGDGEGWYGEPGEHYGPDDLPGNSGPYASNGGLCHCH